MARALQLLGGIQKVLLLYPRQPGQAQPRTATCLSKMDPDQQHLLLKLDLHRAQRA